MEKLRVQQGDQSSFGHFLEAHEFKPGQGKRGEDRNRSSEHLGVFGLKMDEIPEECNT